MNISAAIRSAARRLGFGRAVAGAFVPVPQLSALLAGAGLSFPQWLEQRRATVRQYVEAAPDSTAAVVALEPDAAERTLRAADAIVRHEFDLLGSGAYLAADPDRPVTADGYRPIDWYLDPVRGVRFPRGVPHDLWNLMEMRPPNADIKYPWELARCQHLVTLAQAWRLSGDAGYAREVLNQIGDFAQANPTGTGINWTCTMDVAIRAANWALALALVKDFTGADLQRLGNVYQCLLEHGTFVYGNLENHYEVTSNHFLSNLVGLQFVAAEFGDLQCAREWDVFCRASLEQEISTQVLDDGADFESSLPYHRLVTELFLGGARLAQLQRRPLSAEFHARLATMLDFQLGVLRPDGLAPQVGDADDGRLHIFSGYGDWDRRDPRHLFAPGAMVLERPEWIGFSGPYGRWEAHWWGFSIPSGTRASPLPEVVREYPYAGVAVVRRERVYLAITNGRVGTEGFGNHKHNDLLGFEYHVDGCPLFVDPGSYVYTSDFAARNLFRSTAYHNTLQIDAEEQNELNPEWIFRLFEKADPETMSFSESAQSITYTGRHSGYQRLSEPVIHQRTFTVEPAAARLRIEDRVIGGGEHLLQWHFHLAPCVGCAREGDGVVAIQAGECEYELHYDASLQASIVDAWYSPGYGARQPTRAINFSVRAPIRGEAVFEFGVCSASQATAPGSLALDPGTVAS